MTRRLFGAAIAALLLVPASPLWGAKAGDGTVATARLDVDKDGRKDTVTWTLTPTPPWDAVNEVYLGEADARLTVRFATGARSTIPLPAAFHFQNGGMFIYTTSLSMERLDPAGPPVLALAVEDGYRSLSERMMFVRAVGTARRRSLAAVRFAGTTDVAVFENLSASSTTLPPNFLLAVTGCDQAGGYVDQYRVLLSSSPLTRDQVERSRFRWRAGALELVTVDSMFDGGVKTCGKLSDESTGALERFRRQIDFGPNGTDAVPAP